MQYSDPMFEPSAVLPPALATDDVDSPSSATLPDAGEMTEAEMRRAFTDRFLPMDDSVDNAHESQPGESSAPALRGIPKFYSDFDVGNAGNKRLKRADGDQQTRETINVGSTQGAQLSFSAVVDSIVEECNRKLDYGNRLRAQIEDAVLKMRRKESIDMPWDNMPHRQFWKHAKPPDFFKLPLMGRFDKPASCPIEQLADDELNKWTTHKPFASKRLLAARFAQSDDALLAGALKKLRNILLYDPGESQLGRALLDKAGSLIAEDDLQRSLRDSVASKAVGTVVKRVTDYHKFALFLVSECNKRPLQPDEADFYKYLCHLKQLGAGATSGASLLQAWSFFKFTFGVDATSQMMLVSGRVRGVVNSMFAAKRKLKQAPPLPSDYVYRMERLMQTSNDSRLKTIVGFLLFCVYSCARFGDAAKGDPNELAFQAAHSSDLTLVEIGLSSYKTATGERRAILLPLIALGCDLDEASWAMAWRAARKDSGADLTAHLMSAESHSADAWLPRRMTTAEGSYWTKDILVMLGMDAESANAYSSHSLKATCLSWVSKAGNMTLQERLRLGHHETEEGKMAMTYARDALVSALIKLRRVVEAIKQGLFDPDLPRAERIAQATGSAVDPVTIAEKSHVEIETEDRLSAENFARAAEMNESDVEDADGIGEKAIAIPADKIAQDRQAFPDINPSCCVMHRLSGIVHMISDVEKLACGRKITCNMIPLENSFGNPGQLEFCEQCRAVSGISPL